MCLCGGCSSAASLPSFFSNSFFLLFRCLYRYALLCGKNKDGGKQQGDEQAESADKVIPVYGWIVAAVIDQSHAGSDGIEICQSHISGGEHTAIAIDKGNKRSDHMSVWNAGGSGNHRHDCQIQKQAAENDLGKGLQESF